MDRINGPGVGPGRSFVGGNPGLGIPATTVTAKYMQDLQEEFCGFIEQAGLDLDPDDQTQFQQAIALFTGARPGLLNALLNGNFYIWQRDAAGAGVSTAITAAAVEKYGPDRWFGRPDGVGGAGSIVLGQLAFALGQTDVPGFPFYYCKVTQSIASSLAPAQFGQRIEDVTKWGGRRVTAHVWLRGSAAFNVSLLLTQRFGTGGSADVAAGGMVCAVTTDWQHFILTVDTPSIAGKVLGPGDCFQVHLQFPQGVTYQCDVAQFQLEPSSGASPFDLRPRALELLLCQRYYEKSYSVLQPVGGAVEDGFSSGPVQNNITPNDRMWALNTRFAVEKRAIPAIRWWSPTGTINNVLVQQGTGFNTAVTGTLATSTRATGYPTTAYAAGSGAYVAQAHWDADAEL